MKTLEIVFTKSKKKITIGSWLIRLYTRKPYSHVARKTTIYDQEMYYQASEGRVNYENNQHFKSKHELIKSYLIEVPTEIYSNISRQCLQNCGAKYGFMQNIGILLADLSRLFGIRMTNPWKNGKNCSELIYECVIVPLWGDQGLDSNKVKPHHIENILIEKGYISS